MSFKSREKKFPRFDSIRVDSFFFYAYYFVKIVDKDGYETLYLFVVDVKLMVL